MMRRTKTAAKRPPVKKTPKAASSRRAGRRRNPAGEMAAAAELSEQFHGRPAKRMNEYEEPANERAILTELGALRELEIETPAGDVMGLEFARGVKLASSPNGRQLYLVGGDQAVDLADFGLSQAEAEHDQVLLGHCRRITYHTRKGFHAFEPTDYVHEFGEEGGTLPAVGYDTQNERLYFTGGTYQVKPEGIVN